MIDTLFAMHNIRYIISVDDCYFSPKPDELKAKVYGEMCDSIDAFSSYLTEIGKAAKIGEIQEFSDLGEDTTGLISLLLDSLSMEELKRCFQIAEKSGETFSIEQKGILEFLGNLKDQGVIEQFWTLASINEAAFFDCAKAGITDGAILWLVDRSFERVGESTDAGLEFAKTLADRSTGPDNYIYILSAVGKESDQTEDDIEVEFDALLASMCDNPKTTSIIYYIYKERLLSKKNDRIAKSLAQGFKRKTSFELFNIYRDCLFVSIKAASERISGIKQKTLNYLFDEKVLKKGESCIDFVARMIQILHTDEYNKAYASELSRISEKMNKYEILCSAIKDTVGNAKEMTPILKELRDMELYNRHVNSQFLELSTGDIFQIDSSYYLLISQACDTYLRIDGCRKLKNATLLQIAAECNTEFQYDLSCFRGFTKPSVLFQNTIHVPFDILDLCVLNSSGQACFNIELIKETEMKPSVDYSRNFNIRLIEIFRHIKTVYANKTILDDYIVRKQEIPGDAVSAAYTMLLSEDPYIKKYTVMENKVIYPVQRICRLNELTTVDIAKKFGNTLSRIGHPFDFST